MNTILFVSMYLVWACHLASEHLTGPVKRPQLNLFLRVIVTVVLILIAPIIHVAICTLEVFESTKESQ